MTPYAAFARTIDWFIPPQLKADREMRTRVRMFLFSHTFGPILGNVIPAYLFWLDPGSGLKLAVLAGSITSFWAYPFLVKYTGHYALLSFVSIQNLLFAILWGCYFYGGLSSPFLPWLVTVPLLAFFYLGASARNIALILLQIGGSLAVFVAQFAFNSHFPQTVRLEDMQGIGIISIISASIYVSMMALYYARILASQSEFESEVRRHLETAEQLREATLTAQRASAAKAEFLAKMTHELRTPLNAVIGYSQILLEDSDPSADRQAVEDLNKIHSAGQSLLVLVNAILDLSKIEAGKMQSFPEPVQIEALLGRVCERWRIGERALGAEVALRVERPLGEIETDAAKLEQVLDALIDNAIRHARCGRVEVVADVAATRGEEPMLTIAVVDRGPGIPVGLLPTLFDTFTDRADASVSKYRGPGLGLPLSKRLCGLLGATLTVKAGAPQGARVEIALPLPAAAASDAVSQALPQAA